MSPGQTGFVPGTNWASPVENKEKTWVCPWANPLCPGDKPSLSRGHSRGVPRATGPKSLCLCAFFLPDVCWFSGYAPLILALLSGGKFSLRRLSPKTRVSAPALCKKPTVPEGPTIKKIQSRSIISISIEVLGVLSHHLNCETKSPHLVDFS